MPTVNRSLTAVLLILAVFSVGCSSSNVVATLDATVAAAETAVTIIESTGGIDHHQALLIQSYLGNVGAAASIAATELASTDSVAKKAQVIIAAFDRAVIATNVLNQLPPAIQAAIQGVVSAVQAFLQTVVPAKSVSLTGNPKLGSQNAAKLKIIRERGVKLSTVILHVK